MIVFSIWFVTYIITLQHKGSITFKLYFLHIFTLTLLQLQFFSFYNSLVIHVNFMKFGGMA